MPNVEKIRVLAEVKSFGRLGGQILACARDGKVAEVEAAGVAAVSNAVKAIALANDMSAKEGSCGVAFVPELVSDGPSLKFLRLIVTPRPKEAVLPKTFKTGAIFVPPDLSRAGERGKNSRERMNEKGVATPVELSKTIMGYWLRHVAPNYRMAIVAAKANKASGGKGSATVVEMEPRVEPPFVLPMGADAIARAVKACSIVCENLTGDEYLNVVSPAVVIPIFWEKSSIDRHTNKAKVSKYTVLCLTRADG